MWKRLLSRWRECETVSVVDSVPRHYSILLTPTARGRVFAATGKVEVHEEGGWQCLLLAVRAEVADGTPLAVLLNHEPAGSVVVSGSKGELELACSEDGCLANGLPPVGGIRTVMVATSDGAAVLMGAFPPAV